MAREVLLKLKGYGLITDFKLELNSTGDGLFPEVCFDLIPGKVYEESEDL